jgi:flagellar hook-associated protein 3 FlgL
MIRNLKPDDERFLNSISRIGQRLSQAQREISSGKRLQTPSDNPDQVSNLLVLRADLARVEQIQSNLSRLEAESNTAEQSLSNAVRVLERARTLAAQGVTGTQTATTRSAIAEEVKALIQQLSNASNTYVNGRYIFAGDSDSTQPFVFSAGPPPDVSVYLGSASTRQALHPSGTAFEFGKPGDEIFQNADDTKNAFATLINLYNALNANDEDVIAEQLSNLTSVNDHVNLMLSFYGAIQNQVSEAKTNASQRILQVKSQLTATEDADQAAAILELNRASLDQQAAFESRARLPRRSLFDYLG